MFVIAAIGAGFRAASGHVATAIAGACLAEVVLARLQRGTWVIPTSALLTGVIVGFVLEIEQPWTVTLMVAALASVLKIAVATKRGHFLNPAALALFLAVYMFGVGESWWGAFAGMSLWWVGVLMVVGVVIVERVNKFPMVLAFLGIYFTSLTVLGWVRPLAVAELFRDPFLQTVLFFSFFMLTDPPTSPGKVLDQVWQGGLIAIVSVGAQLMGMGQVYLLFGLLTGNVVLAIQRSWQASRARKRVVERQSVTVPTDATTLVHR